MWRGTGVDTRHYSEASGSRMNVAHSPHPVSPTDGLLACQTEGLPWFPSLIDSGGSPSIISDRLSTPLNSVRKSKRVIPTWETNPPLAPSHNCMATHHPLQAHTNHRQEQESTFDLKEILSCKLRVSIEFAGSSSFQLKGNIVIMLFFFFFKKIPSCCCCVFFLSTLLFTRINKQINLHGL